MLPPAQLPCLTRAGRHRYCYDVVIRCTGMEVDDSIFQLNKPLKKKYGRADRKYPSITAECAGPGACTAARVVL